MSALVKDGFRMRGADMTRLETFTDAAFAFSVSLLVISVGAMPSSYADLITALKALPVFAASFAILMLFWYGHWQWSRRFGLEDKTSILLSLALVFTVLSYVYPLRFMWTLLTYWLSDAALATRAALDSPDQLRGIFAIYGGGFMAMSILIGALNLHAYRLRDALDLSELERFDTRGEIVAWSLSAGVGGLSTLVALLGVGGPAGAGWVYMAMPVLMPGWSALHARGRARLTGELQPA